MIDELRTGNGNGGGGKRGGEEYEGGI